MEAIYCTGQTEGTPPAKTISYMFSDPQWLMLFAQLSLIIIAIIGVFLTFRSISHSRDVAKKTKAIEVVLDAEKHILHEDGMPIVQHYKDNPNHIQDLAAEKLGKELIKEFNGLTNILNHYEYLSVAVKENIICEEILRRSNYSTLIDLVDVSGPFIKAIRIRKGKNNIFSEVEWMQKRWKKAGYSGELPTLG